MDSKVTILIPTKERHQYLKRALEYYKDYSIPIIIADSSLNPIEIHFPNIKYYHFPGLKMQEKISRVLNFIDSDYVMLCADDDFYLQKSIVEASNFLTKNPEFSATHGMFLTFDLCKNAAPVFYPNNVHNYNLNINQNNIEERLFSLFSNYMYLFYSLCKTKLLQKVYNDAFYYKIDNINLVEILHVFYGLIDGKTKSLPILWGARESVIRETTSLGKVTEGIDVVVIADKYKEEYERFIKATALFYIEKELIAYKDAEQIIRKTVQLYISTLNSGTIGRLEFDRINFFVKLKGSIIEKISNKLYCLKGNKFLKETWFKIIFSKHYSESKHLLFVRAKYFNGVPFFNRSGLKEIEKISKIIEKYPVQ